MQVRIYSTHAKQFFHVDVSTLCYKGTSRFAAFGASVEWKVALTLFVRRTATLWDSCAFIRPRRVANPT